MAGPLEGTHLTPAEHDVTFWFSWFALRTDTRVVDYARHPTSTSSSLRRRMTG